MAAITLGVVAVAGAVYSGVQQRKAAKAQARSQAAQQRQADLAAARERRATIRNGRIQQASVEAQAASTGLTGSSAAAASIGNIQTRTNENVSFLDQSGFLSQKASSANAAAASYQQRAGLGQTISGLAQQGAGIYSEFSKKG